MDHPHRYLFLALGLKPHDPAAASEAFQTAMQGYDQLMKEGEYSSMLVPRAVLLPLVEQIDPDLVPEYFWRILAMGAPADNPPPPRISTPPSSLTFWRGTTATWPRPCLSRCAIRWNGRTTKSLLTTLGALWNGHSSTPARPWRGSSRCLSASIQGETAQENTSPNCLGSPTRSAGEKSGASPRKWARYSNATSDKLRQRRG